MNKPLADSLENSNIDRITSLTKGIVGAIPVVGSMVSEIVGTLIPNQRIDRIAKYMQLLESKISSLPQNKLNTLLGNDEFIVFLEEGFIQASRAFSDERREYISNIIVNGASDEEMAYNESCSILKLLGEINDIEVIWLTYYSQYTNNEFREFKERHSALLTPLRLRTNSEDSEYGKVALQEYYCQHLTRLNLLGKSIVSTVKLENKKLIILAS